MAEETAKRKPAALAVGAEPGWAEAVASALAPFGFAVVPARGADEAFAALRARSFDLAVVALDDGGADLPTRLTQLAPGLPVIAASEASSLTQVGDRIRDAVRASLVRLANHLAHDLNNPLGGLKLYVRLLERSLAQEKRDEAMDVAAKIGRAVDQLTEILIEIRRYDRLSAPEREATRLETLLEESLAPARGEAGGVRGDT